MSTVGATGPDLQHQREVDTRRMYVLLLNHYQHLRVWRGKRSWRGFTPLLHSIFHWKHVRSRDGMDTKVPVGSFGLKKPIKNGLMGKRFESDKMQDKYYHILHSMPGMNNDGFRGLVTEEQDEFTGPFETEEDVRHFHQSALWPYDEPSTDGGWARQEDMGKFYSKSLEHLSKYKGQLQLLAQLLEYVGKTEDDIHINYNGEDIDDSMSEMLMGKEIIAPLLHMYGMYQGERNALPPHRLRRSITKQSNISLLHQLGMFGKRSDPPILHQLGMFGKRSDSQLLHQLGMFRKRGDPLLLHQLGMFEKRRDPPLLHQLGMFGKRSGPPMLHQLGMFGKRHDPPMLHQLGMFGKRSDTPTVA